MSETDNCYLLLDLDPDVDDPHAISERIKEKQREWSKLSNSGSLSHKRRAEASLKKLKFIKATLLDKDDPDKRRREALSAKRLIIERRKGLAALIDEATDFLRLSGTYTEANLNTTAAAVKGAFTAADVEALFKKAGLKRAEAKQAAKVERPRLDGATAKAIGANLAVLKIANLYAFLDRTPSASPEALRDRATELREDARKAGKTDVEATARNELLGLCQQVFRDKTEKQKYDNTLAFAGVDDLKPLIELAGQSGHIDFAAYERLMERARHRGIDAGLTREVILTTADERKWHVTTESAAGRTAADLVRCGFCGTVARDRKSHCAHCGEPLQIDCPKCGTPVPTETEACTKCGFRVGDWTWIKFKLEEADEFIASGRVDEAAAQMSALRARSPEWGAIRDRLKSAEEKIAQREKERDRIADLTRQNRRYEADAAADRFERAWGAGSLGALSAAIAEGIAQAQAAFLDGERQRLAGKMEAAIAQYRNALMTCADHGGARDALKRIPPAAPKDLVVTPLRDGFQLRWSAGDALTDSYVVVRKADGTPTHPEDGAWFQAFRDITATNATVQEGVAWHYAVFSRRDGVTSAAAAHSGPHLRLAPVGNLTALAGDGEVRLTWKVPHGAIGVEAWRRGGTPPERPGIGTRLPAARDSLHDAGLANDAPVGYLVVAVFRDPERQGVTVTGPPATCIAVPTALPKPVTDLAVQLTPEGARLSWTPPKEAAVQIRQLSSAPTHPAGAVITREQADAMGTPVVAQAKGSTLAQLGSTVETWFLVLTVKSTIAVVGNAVSIATVDPVRNLKIDLAGRDLHLTWDWPPSITQVAVCHGYDHYPATPDDRDAIRQDIFLAQYRRDGMFTMRRVERRAHYLALFAVAAAGRLHSDAVTRLAQMGQPREFHYRVVAQRKSGWGPFGGERQFQLELRGFGNMPAAVLVAKPRVVPVGPDDGEKVMLVPEMNLQGACLLPIPANAASPGSFAKLFFKDRDNVDEVKLIAGSINEMKL